MKITKSLIDKFAEHGITATKEKCGPIPIFDVLKVKRGDDEAGMIVYNWSDEDHIVKMMLQELEITNGKK